MREIEVDNLEDVYRAMQGENWSPNGEARPLIERLGLQHTSMAIGDAVRDPDGTFWECRKMGWLRLPAEGEAAVEKEEEAPAKVP